MCTDSYATQAQFCSMSSFENAKQVPNIVAVLQIRIILCTLS